MCSGAVVPSAKVKDLRAYFNILVKPASAAALCPICPVSLGSLLMRLEALGFDPVAPFDILALTGAELLH